MVMFTHTHIHRAHALVRTGVSGVYGWFTDEPRGWHINSRLCEKTAARSWSRCWCCCYCHVGPSDKRYGLLCPLLLLFRHSAKSLNGYFTLIGDKAPPVACAYNQRCYHPHTGNSGPILCLSSRIFYPGQSPVRATGGSLPCGCYLRAPLTGNTKGSKCLMVLRVKPTPTRFLINSPRWTTHPCTLLYQVSAVLWQSGPFCDFESAVEVEPLNPWSF